MPARITSGLHALVLLLVAVAVTAPASQGASRRAPVPTCFGHPATIVGTAGDDVIHGTPGADVIVGLAGNDTILGGGGNDLICGGPGNDKLDGGPGVDRIDGGPGRNYCRGEYTVHCLAWDSTAPTLASAAVEGSTLTLVYSKPLTPTEVGISAFGVSVDGASWPVASAQTAGSSVKVTLARSVAGDDVVTVSYDRSDVQDLAGNPAPSFAAVAATNTSPAGCSPTFAGQSLRLGEGLDATSFLPSTGVLKAVMLFVDFSDAPASESPVDLFNRFVPSAQQWFQEVSNGRFALDVTPANEWFRLPQPSTSYLLNRREASGHEAWDYVNDAITAADPHVDFSAYDLVYVVPATGARANTSFATSGLSIADSKNVTFAVELGTETRSTVVPNNAARVLMHETLHALGLPDLYDTSKGNYYAATDEGIGGWDLMSSLQPGGHLLCLAQVEARLARRGSTALRVPRPLARRDAHPDRDRRRGEGDRRTDRPTTAYVLEDRQRTGSDAGLCDTGVLLYRIDAAVGNGGLPIRAVPAHPGTATDPGQNFRCSPIYDAPFDFGSDEVASFSDPAAGLTLQLLGKTPDGAYAIHISRS